MSAAPLRPDEDKLLLVLTLVIGAVVGLVIVAFILITENLGSRMYPTGGAAWRRVLIPIFGSLLAGLLLKSYFPGARGSGIPQTKAALVIHDGFIRFRTVLGRFVCSSITLASGIALGREGPSVQLGAGIASILGRRLGLSRPQVKALVPVGASAALSAAFNTPIAAVLFTLEEVVGDLHGRVIGSIVLSAATSWMVLHLILGDEALFRVPAYQLVHPVEFVAYALLGVLGGLTSAAFVKLLLRLRRQFMRLAPWTLWIQPAAGGVLVGLLGWGIPAVLGVGYGYVDMALNGQMALGVMAGMVVVKMLATATCYASGNAGGVFGPSLFLGAMLGGSVGSVVHMLLPDYTGSVGAYALVGMGTTFAGIIRVPLTSVIMIFELTRDYSIIVPLMISNLISFMISYRLQRTPIYEALQQQEGVHLPEPASEREPALVTAHAMRPATEVFTVSDRVGERVPPSGAGSRQAWPVLDHGSLVGMVTVAELERAMMEGRGESTLGELLPPRSPHELYFADNFPHVHKDHSLDRVLRRMAQARLDVLPVVSREDLRQLQGIVTLQDVLNTYGFGERPRTKEAPPPEKNTSLLAGVLVAVAVVFALTGFLTYYYRAERSAKAEEHYEIARDLAAQGRNEAAIEQYRNALAISHAREHRRALAGALLEVGRLNEARIYLQDLLADDPNSGLANLGLARIAAAELRHEEAVTMYQRAIFGNWPERAHENRIQARFELVEFLADQGEVSHAIRELVALGEAAPHDIKARKKSGRMLLDYGAAGEAAGEFRALAPAAPGDPEIHAGLGEAELAAGRYLSARTALREAVELKPEDEAIGQRLAVAEQTAALDPSLPRLAPAERYRRSRALIERLLADSEACVGADDKQEPWDAARQLLERKGRPASYRDAADSNVTLATELWAARNQLCGAGLADDALRLVLEKLSRTEN